MVSKQLSILSVFLAAFAGSALGAPLPSGDVALRSEADGGLALRLAIRDLLEDVNLDDRDLESQLSELMARAPTSKGKKAASVPAPSKGHSDPWAKKGATVTPAVSSGGSKPAKITDAQMTWEPEQIGSSSHSGEPRKAHPKKPKKRSPAPTSKGKKAASVPAPSKGHSDPWAKKGATVIPAVSSGGSKPAKATDAQMTWEPEEIGSSSQSEKPKRKAYPKKPKRSLL